MPTTVVSFLGTGRKNSPQDPRSGYARTTYRFTLPDNAAFLQTTSLFGVALLRFLHRRGTDVDRWILLGTSASLWSELNQALDYPDAVIDPYCQIDDRVLARTVTAADLQAWQSVLNAHASRPEFRLCLTGDAMEPESQRQVIGALFEHVPPRNDVVFDISHGFRHQPVIATFAVSLMRWTHRVNRVSFFSGVFEARQDDVAPVLELPVCQELVEAAEAAAVLDVTGNYEPVARHLGLDAGLAWFMESTNQLANARRYARELSAHTPSYPGGARVELARLLRDRLQWASHDKFAARCRQSARTALASADYFRAVILGYESLLILAGQLIYPRDDPLSYLTRQRAAAELDSRLPAPDRELFGKLRGARNACAHGTRPDQADAQQLLQSPQEFRSLVQQAFGLFDRLPDLLAG